MNLKKIIQYTCLTSVLYLYTYTACTAQTNLVPNPSFEQFTNCPINTTLASLYLSKPDIWYKPGLRGAQYYNICTNNQPYDGIPYNLFGYGGYQFPRTGVAYMAMGYINNDYNDYIQVKLVDTLIKNTKYYSEYFVNLSDGTNLGCNNIGILFTNKVTYADTINKNLLLANPQIVGYGNPIITDTLGWVKISGIFTAQGGEQYLTLGNFKKKINTLSKSIQTSKFPGGGYYVDDVAVYNLDSFNLNADAGRDTTIHIGDSVFIGSYTNGIDTLQWLQNGIIPIDSTRPGFWVHPLVNTCYVLTQTVNGYSSSDTVCVNVQPLPLKFIQFTAAPTPPKVGLIEAKMDWETMNEISVSHYNIQRSINGKDFITIGTVKANNKQENNYEYTAPPPPKGGIAYYRIEAVDFDGRKTYSEVRNIEYRTRNNELRIYPNPARDVVNIVGKDIKEVRLINCLGQAIHTEIARLNIGQTSYLAMTSNDAIIINTKNFNKGLYIVQVILANGTIKNEKLVVE